MSRGRTKPYHDHKARCNIENLFDFKRGRPKKWQTELFNWYDLKTKLEGCNGDYIYDLCQYIKKAFEMWGHIEIKQVSYDQVIEYINSLTTDRKKWDARTALKSFLDQNENFIMAKLPKMRRRRSANGAYRSKNIIWLSRSQVRVLMTKYLDPRETLIVHLGLILGLRRGGMVDLKLDDIGNGHIHVTEKRIERDIPFRVSDTIERMDTRTVLEKYLEYREHLLRGSESEWLIVGPRSPYFSYDMAKKLLWQLRERLEIKELTYHSMRRTWGRTAWKSGTKIETISELMGHTDTKTTLLYLGINIEDKENAMKRIGDYMEQEYLG